MVAVSIAACGKGSPSEAAKNVLVEQTVMSPEATYIESRSATEGGETRIYRAPAGVDPRELIVEAPTGFSPHYDAPSDSSTAPTSDGTVTLRTYQSSQNQDCVIALRSLALPSQFRDPPAFDPSSQQVILVEFTC